MTLTPLTDDAQLRVVDGSPVPAPGRAGAAAGVEKGAGVVVIDSCHSTWLFDEPAFRFRRILKGLEVDPSLAATDWRPYVRLELAEDSEAFVVVLDEAGTRRIRAWRHVEGCEQCDGETTTELSVEDIRRLSHA